MNEGIAIMNERIKELAKDYLVRERFTKYGESIQEDYYEMYPDELAKFAELIVQECCNWIDGSPSTDAGQLVLTKSFIIDNLKNISELNNERTN